MPGVALDLIGVYLKNYEIDKWLGCKSPCYVPCWRFEAGRGQSSWTYPGYGLQDKKGHPEILSLAGWFIDIFRLSPESQLA